ncbi:hypothetical protein KIW84_053630 [Lathyrus oleraceus]|uniref:Uncharacterized protein n=1 Tax=Pisum sativum TaxID=3888 RepID=A0A9D5AH29_PEA|nr:hypothetical protein KIW84_053630 [Pisum sativum]
MGTHEYLIDIEIKKVLIGGLLLTQTEYICDLLSRAKMWNANGTPTHMLINCKVSKHGTSLLLDPHLYRFIVGAMQYVYLTRLDIMFGMNKACQFMSSPLDSHWEVVKRILGDSDWANDPDDRRSTSGSCIFFGLNLVSWSSKKQPPVDRCSTEFEYCVLVHTTS